MLALDHLGESWFSTAEIGATQSHCSIRTIANRSGRVEQQQHRPDRAPSRAVWQVYALPSDQHGVGQRHFDVGSAATAQMGLEPMQKHTADEEDELCLRC